ncbi:Protein of unknown function [Gryllus bimaculatus]|nr:Protein of unknown function [Gryllus bimaculatus]
MRQSRAAAERTARTHDGAKRPPPRAAHSTPRPARPPRHACRARRAVGSGPVRPGRALPPSDFCGRLSKTRPSRGDTVFSLLEDLQAIQVEYFNMAPELLCSKEKIFI